MAFSQRSIVPGGSVTDPLRVGAQADVMDNPYERQADDYDRLRPRYPTQALDYIAELSRPALLDIGSGSGTFLRQLASRMNIAEDARPADSARDGGDPPMFALDPSRAMEKSFHCPGARFLAAPAERIPLPDASVSTVTCAQAWHWCDPEAAGAEIARVLRPGSSFFIVFNQLNVAIPWIKRLSRIMRSGDVHHPTKPPRVPKPFSAPALHLFSFAHTLSARDIVALGRTRSSYLRASQAGREHMSANLQWYLTEHMGFAPDEDVELAYLCLVWHCSIP